MTHHYDNFLSAHAFQVPYGTSVSTRDPYTSYNAVSPSKNAADFDTNGFFGSKGVRRGNCYAYAMLDCSGADGYKRQPGEASGMSVLENVSRKSCPALVSRVIRDNPNSVYLADPAEQCKPGHYKIMLFAGDSRDGSGGDFHFFRQTRNVKFRAKGVDTIEHIAKRFEVNPSQVEAPRNPVMPGDKVRVNDAYIWTQKAGLTVQSLTDSCGRIIKDPRQACRTAGSITYSNLCSTFCVKRKR